MTILPDQKKSFRFLHIPKTAGTTFNKILFKQYNNHKIFKFHGDAKNMTKTATRCQDEYAQLISTNPHYFDSEILYIGHSWLNTFIPDAKTAHTVTFIRDPVNRVLSFIQHKFQEDIENKKPIEEITNQLKIDHMESCIVDHRCQISNLHTKMLINRDSCDSQNDIDALIQNNKNPEDAAYECLIKNMSVFGLTEKFDQSIILFKIKLNWKYPFYFKVRQRTQLYKIDVSRLNKTDKKRYDALIEKIIDLNIYDINLYQKAEKYFHTQIQAYSKFNRTLKIFKLFKFIMGYKLFVIERRKIRKSRKKLKDER